MPRMLPTALALVAASIFAGRCSAQGVSSNLRRDESQPSTIHQSPGTLAPTPEMWFYEQERKRHDDPKMAVHRRAELRAQERHQRLASLRWYGIDNSRPNVSANPWCGVSALYWGWNPYDAMLWNAAPAPATIAR
jgi:hypothetical protein